MSFLNKLTRYLDYKLIVNKVETYIAYTKYKSRKEIISNKGIKILKTNDRGKYKNYKLNSYLLKIT